MTAETTEDAAPLGVMPLIFSLVWWFMVVYGLLIWAFTHPGSNGEGAEEKLGPG